MTLYLSEALPWSEPLVALVALVLCGCCCTGCCCCDGVGIVVPAVSVERSDEIEIKSRG